MDITQLQYFVVAGQRESFSEAGRRLYVSESAVQKQLRKLETELGVTLFQRQGRKVQLTSDGKMLLQEAEYLLQQSEQFLEVASHIREGKVGSLTISCYEIHLVRFLATMVSEFQRQNPSVSISVRDYPQDKDVEGDALYQYFSSAAPDLIVGPQTRGDFESILLYRARVVVLFPEHHPLRHQDSVSAEMLQGNPLVLLPARGIWFRSELNRVCAEFNFTPAIRIETSVLAMRALVASGWGLGLLTDDNIDDGESYPKLIDVGSAVLEIEHRLQWRRDTPMSAAMQKFIEYAQQGLMTTIL